MLPTRVTRCNVPLCSVSLMAAVEKIIESCTVTLQLNLPSRFVFDEDGEVTEGKFSREKERRLEIFDFFFFDRRFSGRNIGLFDVLLYL